MEFTVNLVDQKASAATIPAPLSITTTGSRGTPIQYCKAIYLRNYEISGNGSALPPVLMMHLSLETEQVYTVVSTAGIASSPLTQPRLLLFPQAAVTNSVPRLLAQAKDDKHLLVLNGRSVQIDIVNVDGSFTKFTDYTALLLEFVCVL